VNSNRTYPSLAASTARSGALVVIGPGGHFTVNGAVVSVAVAFRGEINLGAGKASAPAFVDLRTAAALLAATASFGAGRPGRPTAGEAVQRLLGARQGAGKVSGPEETLHRPVCALGERIAAFVAHRTACVSHVKAGSAVNAGHLVVRSLELALFAVHATSLVAGLVGTSLATFAARSGSFRIFAASAGGARRVSSGGNEFTGGGLVKTLGTVGAADFGRNVVLAAWALPTGLRGASDSVELAVGTVVAIGSAVVALELAHLAGCAMDGTCGAGEFTSDTLLAPHGRFGRRARLMLASGASLAHAGSVFLGVRALGANEAAGVPVERSRLVGTLAASDASAGGFTGAADAHVAGRTDSATGAFGGVEGILELTAWASVAFLLVAGAEFANRASFVVAALPELGVLAVGALGA